MTSKFQQETPKNAANGAQIHPNSLSVCGCQNSGSIALEIPFISSNLNLGSSSFDLEVARFLRNRGSQFLFWGNRATRIGSSIPEKWRFAIPVLGESCHLYYSPHLCNLTFYCQPDFSQSRFIAACLASLGLQNYFPHKAGSMVKPRRGPAK